MIPLPNKNEKRTANCNLAKAATAESSSISHSPKQGREWITEMIS
jgi:hypothetical protein